MNDQAIMENLLHTTKGACDLYMHGTIESPTPNVRSVFDDALNESLCMQGGLYSKMQNQGWYQTEQAQQQQLQKIKSKYAGV